MRRTIRQEGLVDQGLLSRLRISLIGDQGGLRDSFIVMGEQLGASVLLESDGSPNFTVYLGDEIVPEFDSNYIRVILLDDGVQLTRDKKASPGSPSKLQAGGLATIGAALAWQEILRMCGAILPIEIPKRYITVNLRVDPASLGGIGEIEHDMVLETGDGSELPFSVLNRDDGTGHSLIRARLEQGHELADSLLNSLSFCRRGSTENAISSSEIKFRLPRAEGSLSGNGIIAGVGGLGSWALDTLIKSFRDSSNSGEHTKLSIIDPDLSIEIHNLNRQVLYQEEDLGLAKAEIAKRRLEDSIDGIRVTSYNEEIGTGSLQTLHHDGIKTEDSSEDFPWADDLDLLSDGNLLDQDFPGICRDIDFILCGVDNLRARAILCGISSEIGIPMINAGAQGFHGQFDLFTEGGSCMLCRYGLGVLSQSGPMSCQEDGEVPFGSIVTSTALFGAIEGLAMISVLAGGPSSLEKWPSQVSWSGRRNTFSMEYAHDFGMFSMIFDSPDNHSKHIRELVLGESQEECEEMGVTGDMESS